MSDTMHKRHYIELHFYEIIKYVATCRMLILKRETIKHLKTVFYHPHVQNTNNGSVY